MTDSVKTMIGMASLTFAPAFTMSCEQRPIFSLLKKMDHRRLVDNAGQDLAWSKTFEILHGDTTKYYNRGSNNPDGEYVPDAQSVTTTDYAAPRTKYYVNADDVNTIDGALNQDLDGLLRLNMKDVLHKNPNHEEFIKVQGENTYTFHVNNDGQMNIADLTTVDGTVTADELRNAGNLIRWNETGGALALPGKEYVYNNTDPTNQIEDAVRRANQIISEPGFNSDQVSFQLDDNGEMITYKFDVAEGAEALTAHDLVDVQGKIDFIDFTMDYDELTRVADRVAETVVEESNGIGGGIIGAIVGGGVCSILLTIYILYRMCAGCKKEGPAKYVI